MSISATCSTISRADPRTRAILLYVEGITHGRKFMSAARAAARSKPVLVLKAGRSHAGARAAASHTGMLAGSDAVYDAAFRRAGMLRVGTMAELFDAAETLALTARTGRRAARHPDQWRRRRRVWPPMRLRRLAGGWPTLAPADDRAPRPGAAGDLEPRQSGRHHRRRARGALCGGARRAVRRSRDRRIPGAELPDGAGRAREMRAGGHRQRGRGCPPARAGRNMFTAWLGEHSAAAGAATLHAARIATYETPEAAVSGFLHRVRYQRNQELLMETPPARPDPFEPDARAVRQVIADALAPRRPAGSKPKKTAAVLAAYGIPHRSPASLPTPEQAAAAAAAIGFPVALKIRSPDIMHKTDVGGVALNLPDPESGARGCRRIARARPSGHAPTPGSTAFSCSR